MYSPILILASSRKPGGICLAGKRFDGAQRGAWVRPVWERTGYGWSAGVLGARAGRIPRVGDVFGMPLTGSLPWEHQPENWQVGEGAWGYAGHHDSQALIPFADDQEALWKNHGASSAGINDRVPAGMALLDGDGSLRLIRATRLRFIAGVEFGRPKLRAQFVHGGNVYRLCVTDLLACERWLARLAAGHNGATEALLCISLGQPLGGYCYKLIAGVSELS